MRHLSYYTTRATSYPSKEDFGKVYVYRAGRTVYEGELKDWSEVKPRFSVGYTIEKVQDREAYLAARAAHVEEGNRLQAEFKADLFAEHDITSNPKAERCFELAREYGGSPATGEFIDCFEDLVELIK